jgi:hypothetical protein
MRRYGRMTARRRPGQTDGAKRGYRKSDSPSSVGGNEDGAYRLARPIKEKDADRLLLVWLRFRLPEEEWFGPFSRHHPNALIEVLSVGEVNSDVSVGDIWVSGQPPGVWREEIATFRGVVSVDALWEVGEGTLYRVTMRNPPIIYLYRRLGLPLPLPVRMQGGFARWEVVARARKFNRVLEWVGQTGLEPQILSIRGRPLKDHLPMLSDAQQVLLNQAIYAGYFAVPREITLTALARKLGRSKSAVSESLALIEKKLLENALGPRGPFFRGGQPGGEH